MMEFKEKIIAVLCSEYPYTVEPALHKCKWLYHILRKCICVDKFCDRFCIIISSCTDISAVVEEQLCFQIRMCIYHSFGSIFEFYRINRFR